MVKYGTTNRIGANPQSVLGVKEYDLDFQGDWSGCYPVIFDGVCVGVVSVLDNPPVVVAGVGGGIFDEARQAYIKGETC